MLGNRQKVVFRNTEIGFLLWLNYFMSARERSSAPNITAETPSQRRIMCRRDFLALAALAGGSALLAACDVRPAPVKPTEAPKPAEAAKPTEAPKPTEAAKPVETKPDQSAPAIAKKGVDTLNGAGATFPAPLYGKWFEAYYQETGIKVNYQAVGSGGGIKGLIDNTVDFGASDAALSKEQREQAQKNGSFIHVPTTAGSVVPAYNLPEVSRPVQFSAESLGAIFSGKATKWDDGRIKQDNPGLVLPDRDIIPVHRSDGSGTTFVFTTYLEAASQDWKGIGRGTTVSWPGGIGGQGNAGVTGEVKANPGAIGYVELEYATSNKVPFGPLRNQEGEYILASGESVGLALSRGAESMPEDLAAEPMVNLKGKGVYGISALTYVLSYEGGKNSGAVAELFKYMVGEKAQAMVPAGYVALPPELRAKALRQIERIKG